MVTDINIATNAIIVIDLNVKFLYTSLLNINYKD